jgi:hypothetical protein
MNEIVLNAADHVEKKEIVASNLTLVRTVNAGVHFGVLVSAEKGFVVLENAKRIWRWSGANTLNEVAEKGVDADYTRISEPVTKITLLDAIELIPISDSAAKTLGTRWAD